MGAAMTCHIDGLPPELLIDILSRLSLRQQLGVRRVSRRWKDAVSVCLARRQELRVDPESGIPDLKTLLSLLQKMPALRRIYIGRYFEMPKTPRKLVLVSEQTIERLCNGLPQLQEVTLDCELDESRVQTLLRLLPDLTKLDLPDFGSGGESGGEFLSLLPVGLQSLSLRNEHGINPTSVRHMTRCQQLREVRLGRVGQEMLQEALASCPQLERLYVGNCYVSNLTAALAHCPHLRELHICVETLYNRNQIDLFGVLKACNRLERLRVSGFRITLPPSDHGPISLRRPVSLTHLEMHSTQMDDDTFWRLTQLIPDLLLFKLREGDGLTQRGLAGGLQCLTNLQVLDLSTTLSSVLPVLTSLTSLKALSCDSDREPQTIALRVAAALQKCPTLSLLRLLRNLSLEAIRFIVDELEINPPEYRVVTLILKNTDVPQDLTSRLPSNVRVVTDTPGVWERLTGRHCGTVAAPNADCYC